MVSNAMRVLVCGGRSYNDYSIVAQILDDFHRKDNITLIIHGACTGADTMAEQWANEYFKCAIPHNGLVDVIRSREQ